MEYLLVKNKRNPYQKNLSIENLNLFVGSNDAERSNVLKVLNLFFNNQTDENSDFNFDLNYSKLAPGRSK